jgi:hypothetical protein
MMIPVWASTRKMERKAPMETSGLSDRVSEESKQLMVLDFTDMEVRNEAYNPGSDFDRGVVVSQPLGQKYCE